MKRKAGNGCSEAQGQTIRKFPIDGTQWLLAAVYITMVSVEKYQPTCARGPKKGPKKEERNHRDINHQVSQKNRKGGPCHLRKGTQLLVRFEPFSKEKDLLQPKVKQAAKASPPSHLSFPLGSPINETVKKDPCHLGSALSPASAL